MSSEALFSGVEQLESTRSYLRNVPLVEGFGALLVAILEFLFVRYMDQSNRLVSYQFVHPDAFCKLGCATTRLYHLEINGSFLME